MTKPGKFPALPEVSIGRCEMRNTARTTQFKTAKKRIRDKRRLNMQIVNAKPSSEEGDLDCKKRFFNLTGGSGKVHSVIAIALLAGLVLFGASGIAAAENGPGAADCGFKPMLWVKGDAPAADAAWAEMNQRGFGYIEMNYKHPLAYDYSLSLHVGHRMVRNYQLSGYTDYKLSISKPFGGFNLGAAYMRTNVTGNTHFHVPANGDDVRPHGSIFALSVGRSF